METTLPSEYQRKLKETQAKLDALAGTTAEALKLFQEYNETASTSINALIKEVADQKVQVYATAGRLQTLSEDIEQLKKICELLGGEFHEAQNKKIETLKELCVLHQKQLCEIGGYAAETGRQNDEIVKHVKAIEAVVFPESGGKHNLPGNQSAA